MPLFSFWTISCGQMSNQWVIRKRRKLR
eukprot:UN19073